MNLTASDTEYLLDLIERDEKSIIPVEGRSTLKKKLALHLLYAAPFVQEGGEDGYDNEGYPNPHEKEYA